MADFARPPKLVTMTVTRIDTGAAADLGSPLLKYRIKGSAAGGTEATLSHPGTGTYTVTVPNVPGAQYRFEAGSSDPADLCEVGELTYSIPALEFPT
jgi:hypothetical protein